MDNRKYWKVVSIIDRDTGEHRQQYFFKRARARRIPLSSQLARQLAGYCLIDRDLRTVVEWLTELKKLVPPSKKSGTYGWSQVESKNSIHIALFVAALTFYGKCFAQSESRSIRLSIEWVPKEFHDTHQEVIALRNKFAAHSGDEEYEKVNVVLVLADKKGKLRDSWLLYRELKQIEVITQHPDDSASFEALARELQRKVNQKMQDLNDRIFKDEINPAGLDYWLTQSMY